MDSRKTGHKMRQAIDAAQLLNPGTVSTLSMLFPDAKYDVALVQDAWQNRSSCSGRLGI